MEIITISKDGEESNDAMSKLYEASIEGSVPSLESLIEKDKLILSKISLTTFSDTPLHISALLGHTHFVRTLLDLQPSLAWALDSQNCRTALHLASANGHVDVVRELLRVRKQFVDRQQGEEDMCMVKDGEGRVALHYAAMRGHVGVIELLVAAQPKSVLETVPEGETVLHLCVQYNKVEALKFLLSKSSELLINSTDSSHGNTVLHLAVLLKQVETVKHLLTVPGLKQDTVNSKGLKASDILEQLPQTDLNTLKLKLILLTDHHRHHDKVDKPQADQRPKRCRCWGWQCLNTLHSTSSKWLECHETRACIMVVAALIVQTTFQSVLDPPGLDEINNITEESNESDPTYWSTDLKNFIIFNSIAFVSSLGVIMLIVGGLPLTNKFCMWLTNVAMLITLTFTALSYLFGMRAALINSPTYEVVFNIMFSCSFTWLTILAILTIVHTLLSLVWLSNKLRTWLVLGDLKTKCANNIKSLPCY